MNKESFCNFKIDDMKGSFLCKSMGDIGFGKKMYEQVNGNS
jgi:hypothetical protein